MASRSFTIAVALGALTGIADADHKTAVTIWADALTTNEFGGATYGGFAATTGGFVTEQRELDVGVGAAEVHVAVPSTIDAASVHVRDLTDPAGVTITAQRFIPAARTPTEMIARQIGQPITVVTTKGELTGTLRAVDEQSLVVDTAGHTQVLRREGYVLDIKLPSTGAGERASLAWRLTAKKPGKHLVELGYRADGLAWSADYAAILDEAGASMDFRAWATIKNQSSGVFDDAMITLVSGGTTMLPGQASTYPMTTHAAAQRFALAAPVDLRANETVQVELVPARVGVKPKHVIAYEAMTDPSPDYQQYPNTDCGQFNGQGADPGTSQLALEIELAPNVILPPGRVRLFQRRAGGQIDVLSEDVLVAQAGSARIRLAADTEVTAARVQTTCDLDEQKHTLREKIELKFENKAKKPLEVVAREYLWRSTMWKIENDKNRPPTGQTHEFRVALPAGGKQTVTYVVVYTWN